MSNYAGFAVKVRDHNGVVTNVGAGVDVAVRAEGEVADEPESPLTTDSNGEIASGTLAGVPAGTRVHFRVPNYQGGASSATQVMT